MIDGEAKELGEDSVALSSLAQKMNLCSLTPDIDIKDMYINAREVNRPSLQFAGFFDQFDNDRIQIIGNIEYAYLQSLTYEVRMERLERIFTYGIPCMVFCRSIIPDDDIINLALEYNTPLFKSTDTTSAFMGEVIRWLNVRLAPGCLIHGVLIDVNGVGVLILGESGIGKSEAALELLNRGHRLVTDDAVEIRKVSDETLIGRSPGVTKHFMELRGIGIIDVKELFGVQSVIETVRIDMVIRLEEWDERKKYERLGLEDEYTEYLGNRVVCHTIPMRPGRNIAVIVETAALNHRQKGFGYNAAKELYERLQHEKHEKPGK